ncbi:hypothetical protein KBD69_03530 [Candidatus Woesebacteria bacterium]|nr:hypothetical protein [Candidatus Woesebacteria bacterium]
MLTNSDKDDIRDLIREELDRVENKIDKVLSIVTRTDQEHQITQAKVNKLEKRTTNIEKKVGIKPPASTTVFA